MTYQGSLKEKKGSEPVILRHKPPTRAAKKPKREGAEKEFFTIHEETKGERGFLLARDKGLDGLQGAKAGMERQRGIARVKGKGEETETSVILVGALG